MAKTAYKLKGGSDGPCTGSGCGEYFSGITLFDKHLPHCGEDLRALGMRISTRARGTLWASANAYPQGIHARG